MRRHARRHARRAAALISAVAILVVVAAFAALLLHTHGAQLASEETGIHRLRAQAAAQAATHLTLWRIGNDSDLQEAMARVVYEGDTSFAADPLFAVSGDLAGATFSVDVWPGPGTVRLKSTGVSGGVYYERWAQMPMTLGAAISGVAVSNRIKLKRRSVIDSFSSAAGPYGGANVSSRAVISTNSTKKDRIHLRDYAVVNGSAMAGPDGDPARVIKVERRARITGSTSALDEVINIPAVSEPTGMGPSQGNLTVRWGRTTWSSNQHYRNVEIRGLAVLEISGDVTVLCDREFKLKGFARLRILPGSRLTLYTKGKAEFSEFASANLNTADPTKFLICVLTNKELKLKRGARVYATGISPNGKLKLEDWSHFYGTFLGKEVEMEDTARLHVDLK